MSAGPVVLVVGSGGRRYREYLLAGASRQHQLWLLDSAEPAWQRRYVRGASVVPLLDPVRIIPDEEVMLTKAMDLATRMPLSGVFTYDETLVMATAHIAETLGLPGLTVAGADRCRNKHRTRQVLTAAGLPQPRFVLARTAAEAAAAAEEVGFPVVAKPRGMGASIGVVRAQSAPDLTRAFQVAHEASYQGNPAYEGGVLVEEQLVGTEISVDGVVVRGDYRPLFLARKQIGPAPYCEEVGHVVDPDDELLTDQSLCDVLTRTHRALGLHTGITHTEVMLTDRGPAVVEVNARLGGDLIPYLGALATGIDPGQVAAVVATGSHVSLNSTRKQVVGVRFLYPPEDCRVVSVTLPPRGRFPWLVEAKPLVDPGTELRLPPKGYIARYAYVICAASDAAECRQRLATATAAARLAYEPPEADPASLLG